MTISVTKTSVKGQVVIPQKIREELGIKAGQLLLVYAKGNVLILKKLEKPEPYLFSTLAKPVREEIKRRNITKEDVEEAIKEIRKVEA